MISVIILTILFSLSTVASILLLGSRSIIGGEMNFLRIIQILFTWQFILGAFFAFFSRLVFMLINSALYKTPNLSQNSTSVTTLITNIAIVFVLVANYYFLGERLSNIQLFGALVIFVGIFLVTR